MLEGGVVGHRLGVQPPARIRIAPPGAAAAARRIHQHAVKTSPMMLGPAAAAFFRTFGLVEDMKGHIANTRPLQPRWKTRHAFARYVAGRELTTPCHGRGQRQRFAPRSGAVIGYIHAWFCVHQERYKL